MTMLATTGNAILDTILLVGVLAGVGFVIGLNLLAWRRRRREIIRLADRVRRRERAADTLRGDEAKT
jgi:hypothetical protein